MALEKKQMSLIYIVTFQIKEFMEWPRSNFWSIYSDEHRTVKMNYNSPYARK